MNNSSFEASEAYTPTERQFSNLVYQTESLQVGGREMKAISGTFNAAPENSGFASNEQLLADLTGANQPDAALDYPAPTNQQLLDQFHKSFQNDTSPESLARLKETTFPGFSTEKIKETLGKMAEGQDAYLKSLTPKQLEVVGNMSGAIKDGDMNKLAQLMRDTPPLITKHLASAIQYDLQTKGIYKKVTGVIENDRAYLQLKDRATNSVTRIDMQTGISTGPKPIEDIQTK